MDPAPRLTHRTKQRSRLLLMNFLFPDLLPMTPGIYRILQMPDTSRTHNEEANLLPNARLLFISEMRRTTSRVRNLKLGILAVTLASHLARL